MSISVSESAFVVGGSRTIALSSMFSVTASAGNPSYLILTGLDRNEYPQGSTGATGTLNGNGHSDSFTGIGGDARGAGIAFTLQSSTGRYYNSTYGYLDQMTYTSSGSSNDVTSLSLYGTSSASLASTYAANAYALMQLDAKGYLGSATIATQPSFAGVVPTQATPNSIAQTAMTFVGKAWNGSGCWTLASTIAAEAGTALPLDSTAPGVTGNGNGEWFVAFDGSRQSGNWQSMLKAGEVIVISDGKIGHIATCVSGSGSTAMLVDNVTMVNGTGTVLNPANDGSANDVIVVAPHPASQEWTGVLTSQVKIYELDTPVVSAPATGVKLALNARQALSTLFSATDPAGAAITQYQVYDTAASDALSVNGVTVNAHSAAAAATANSLTSVSLVAGATVTTDTIDVRAFNGSFWGDWQTLTVTVTSTAPAAPTQPAVTPSILVHQTPNQTWKAGQLLSFTLPSNTFSETGGQITGTKAYQTAGASAVSWLHYNGTSETFTGTVPTTATGSITIEVDAQDTHAQTAIDTFSVTFANGTVTTKLIGTLAQHATNGWELMQLG